MNSKNSAITDINATEESRRAAYSVISSGDDTITIRLGYRQPYDFGKMLAFFAARALEGVEKVEGDSYERAVRINDVQGDVFTGWIRVSDDNERRGLIVTISSSLAPVLSNIISRVRRQFDLDCDPNAIADKLASLSNTGLGMPAPGLRLPGCFVPFETICRAVIGQQVSVKAANAMAARIVKAYGTLADTDIDGLTRVWPSPKELLAIDDLESAFGKLGIIKNRTHAIEAIAKMLESKELSIDVDVSFEEQIETLLSIKGIGPWTANYIAMRALGYPDAFLESDAGVAHALPDMSPKERLALAEQWRPWRSYAVIALWNSLE